MKETSVFKAAWLTAFVIVISKFAGFVRDVVIANYYGAGLASDAYFYAYQLPSLAIVLIGGAGGPLHSAVVSVFAKITNPDDKQPSEKANKLFNTFITVSFLFFLLLAVIVFVFSEQIMSFIIRSDNTELIYHASNHLKIMTPIIVIGGIIGIYYGLLVTYRCFLLPNISPSILSVCIVITLLITKGDNFGASLAIGTAIGALCQFLIQVPAVRKLGYKIKPNLDIKNNQGFKTLLELALPAALSSAIGQIYVYVDMFFASSLGMGAWTSIGYANRIFQFPAGLLSAALLVPLFPIFSKLAGEKKFDEIKQYFNKGIGLLNFAAVPVMFIIIMLASDIITIVFQRGRFDNGAAAMVSEALIFLSLAIIPYVFRDSVTRIFYSFNDSKTPFIVAASSVVMKFILNALFINKLGIAAITLSTSLVTLINGSILGILVRKKIELGCKNYFINLAKMFLAAFLAYFIVMYVYNIWEYNSWTGHVIKTAAVMMLYLIVYSVTAPVLRIEPAEDFINKVRTGVKNKLGL